MHDREQALEVDDPDRVSIAHHDIVAKKPRHRAVQDRARNAQHRGEGIDIPASHDRVPFAKRDQKRRPTPGRNRPVNKNIHYRVSEY
jgi:hypothetical protein